jgi:geranylgeranyl diphosphate synthase type I
VTSPTTASPAALREAIASALDAFVEEQLRRLEPLGPDAARLVAAAHQALTGGKRLRASFCYWGFQAVPGSAPADEPSLLRAAAALELLHASALVHDDLMDDSSTRRGRPAVHASFEALHRDERWSGPPQRYGAAAAILLGDLLLSWSDELLRTCGLGHDVVRAALGYLDSTRSEVIAGQFLDVSVQARGACDVEAAMRVLRYKSAKYSIERPLHIGAALAGAGPAVQDSLTAFGLPLGEAFQLRDDLLGVFGDPSVTGKPAGDDLREGKRTVLVALALEGSDAQGAALLEQRLGTDLADQDIVALQSVITASGAAQRVETMIDELTAESLRALSQAQVTDRAREALQSLAAAATRRVD